MIAHAGLIAARTQGAWRGVLIEGPSGAGKSGLALLALAEGFRLVADDRVVLWTSDGRLYGRAPESLSGLMEVRGLDVVRLTPLPFAEVTLVARLGRAERMPDPAFADILGLQVPLIILEPGESTAPAKLGRALNRFDAAGKRRI